jgi:4-amino-4-deoxy-L-arabinose transferase-like glycosyltransferase
VLLVGTALLYLWGLGESGWANSFYSAAAQAGSVSWKAFFYASSDAGNAITVDKTPASLWLMALSVRIFGLSSWSVLAPQALAGVASVGVLYTTVRRWYGSGAGLLAGAVLALTPVAVLMFRFNNPDALLTLLLVLSAYATARAVETASTRWLVLAGLFVGFGFLAKMLQAFLVVPALAATYLIAAPTDLRRRVRQVLAAGAAMLAGLGWWVAIVALVPASWRPYIGGSQHNSILELTFGYNGFGRLTGDEVGSVTGGPGPRAPGGQWGVTGLTRLFDSDNGGQISWLLPAALILLVAGLLTTRAAPRTERARAGFLLWGGWLAVTMLTFSLMAGIFHPYYSVALAPAIGALVGMGAGTLWRRRDGAAMLTLAAVVAVTALWSTRLLGRSAGWLPWLSPLILVVGIGAAIALVVSQYRGGSDTSGHRQLAINISAQRWRGVAISAALAAGIGASLAGPAAYAVETASTPHTGAIPSAGPPVTAGRGGGPGGFGGLGFALPGGRGGAFPGGSPPAGAFPNFGRNGRGAAPFGTGRSGRTPGGVFPGGPGAGLPGAGGPSAGGLLDASTPGRDVVAALQAGASRYTWAAAAIGSNIAAGYQLASGEAVMPIGGFNGSDPFPTLAQFQQYVAAGRIHYFIGGGGFVANGGSTAPRQIAAWVAQTFTAKTIDGVSLYDLTAGRS